MAGSGGLAGGVGFAGLQILDDLRHDRNRLLDAAGLTAEERKRAVALFRERMGPAHGTGA